MIHQKLSPKRAAKLLSCCERTLIRWRESGYGPAYTTIEGRIWYDIDDLIRHLEIHGAPVHGSRPSNKRKETIRCNMGLTKLTIERIDEIGKTLNIPHRNRVIEHVVQRYVPNSEDRDGS